MRLIVAALAILAAPMAASATCTWSTMPRGQAQVSCDASTESAPTLATQGLKLSDAPPAIVVVVSADSGSTISSGGTPLLKAYLYVDALDRWVRAPDLDLTITAAGERSQTWPAIYAPNKNGRIAYVPSGVVTAAVQRVTIFIN